MSNTRQETGNVSTWAVATRTLPGEENAISVGLSTSSLPPVTVWDADGRREVTGSMWGGKGCEKPCPEIASEVAVA